MKVFVTVGTTQFEKLIEELSKDEILDLLYSLGYNFIQFQVGAGRYIDKQHPKIKLKYRTYFENFSEEIENSDLVISHGGAGTCLEVLKKRKPLIVVINEELMDNHQIELAQHLAKHVFLQCCTISNLKTTLCEKKFTQFQHYPEPNTQMFARYLDKCMGFASE